MHNTPERLAIIRRMVDIVVEEAVWTPTVYPVTYALRHRWSRNAKPHGITGGYLKYREVDGALRERLRRQWNRPNYGMLFGSLAALGVLSAVLALFRKGMFGGIRS